jgi:6-pyruvoyltetrahydropterin/6-carboxytetrahydropterin synthase
MNQIISNSILNLEKENFKFSAAHFLIFDKNNAERLHGHNYRVRVQLLLPEEKYFASEGFHLNFTIIKEFLNNLLSGWDEMVLLPKLNPDVRFVMDEQTLHFYFSDRYYAFPKNEVLLLPINNTSVEQMAGLLAQSLWKRFEGDQIQGVKVSVEETSGQSAIRLIGPTF